MFQLCHRYFCQHFFGKIKIDINVIEMDSSPDNLVLDEFE